MRKIDKSKILSTEYKKWEESLEKSKTQHPTYDSNNKYYIDVVMNLLHAQNGLCAYTEQVLCEESYYDVTHWKNGRYKGKKQSFGELEHFDSSKKVNQAWLWDNFLLIDTDVNRRKSAKEITYHLKPDAPNYEPFYVLAYDRSKHIFIANPLNESLTDNEKQLINKMLYEVFQINHPTIISRRRNVLEPILEYYRFFKEIEMMPKEFPTALEMCIREMK